MNNSSYRKVIVSIILISLSMLNGFPGYSLTVSGSTLISGGVESGEVDYEKIPKILKMEISDGVFNYATLTWANYGGLGKYFSEREPVREGDTYYSGFKYSFKAMNQSTSNVHIIVNLEEETFEGTISGTIISPNVTWGDYYENGYNQMGYVTPPNGLYAYQNTGTYSGTISGKLQPIGWHKPPEAVQYRINGTVELEITYSAKLIAHKTISGGPEIINAYYEVQEEKTISRTGTVQDTFSWHTKYPGLISGGFSFWMQDYENGPSASFSTSASGDDFFDLFEVLEWYEENDVSISGPSTIEHSEAGEAVFELASGQEGIDTDRVEWIFYYQDESDNWVEHETLERDALGALTIPREGEGFTLTELESLLWEHGATTDATKALAMKVDANVYLQEQLLTTATHSYTVQANLDVTLTVGGPTLIAPDRDMDIGNKTFTLTAEEGGQGSVRWIDWVFEYRHESGEWRELNKLSVEGEIKDLQVAYREGSIQYQYWYELAGSNGRTEGDKRLLDVRVTAKAVSYEEKVIAESQPYQLTVEYEGIVWMFYQPELDVYPTMPSSTDVEIFYGTLDTEDPFKFEAVDVPPYLTVTFDPPEITTTIRGTNKTKMSVELDVTKLGAENIPSQIQMELMAKSGAFETKSSIKISLLPAEWLVMYYVATDTKDSLQQFEQENLLNIMKTSGGYSEPGVGVITMIDLKDPWNVPLPEGQLPLKGNNAYIMEIEDGELKVIIDVGSANMGEGDLLKLFIKTASEIIPAEKRMLILSDHGEGIRGMIFDSSHNGVLDIKEIKVALAPNDVDILVFDACYMAQLEVLYELVGYTDLFVASEVKVPNEGLPYLEVMSSMYHNPGISPLDVGFIFIDDVDFPDKRTNEIALIDASAVPDIVVALDELVDYLWDSFDSNPKDTYRLVSEAAFMSINEDDTSFDDNYNMIIPRGHPYFDLQTFSSALDDKVSFIFPLVWEGSVLLKAIDDAVLAIDSETYSKSKNEYLQGSLYNGISIFMPPTNTIYRKYARFYEATSFSEVSDWGEFIDLYSEEWEEEMNAISSYFHLTHPGHELYPHVYDSEGRHVGYDPDHWSRTKVEYGIPGAFYMDFNNGTKVLSLPGEISEYQVVIDGLHMEEEVENYTLTSALMRGGEIIHQETLEGTIEEGTSHSMPVQVTSTSVKVGETTVITPEPEPEPEPEETEPESGEEPDKPGGIPGFGFNSVLIGVVLSMLAMWLMSRRIVS
ncbi:Peptidase C11, clostripain [Thaumarchaeota archaeon SCGC AB-539-E09]|nr:Peptidase C11, clostripain [Thaumarchaeota archaeon SCGC AB-539-E09]